jgi:hypothetical protein
MLSSVENVTRRNGAQEGRAEMLQTHRAKRIMAVALALTIVATVVPSVGALEVGEPAPGFTLAATTGGDISLSDFKGKKFVLLEFYGADFAPA